MAHLSLLLLEMEEEDLTLEVIAHHPLLMVMHDESTADVRGVDITGFTLMEKPVSEEVGRALVELWLMRKGMKVQFHRVGVIDVSARRIFKVDYLVEVDRTPLFVLWHSTERRRQNRREMQEYAKALSQACLHAFGRRVEIVLVNMYHTGVEGGLA